MCCGSNFDLVALRLRTRSRPGDGGDSACLRNEALYAIGERTEFTSVLIVQQLVAVARRITEKDLVLARHALDVLTYLSRSERSVLEKATAPASLLMVHDDECHAVCQF